METDRAILSEQDNDPASNVLHAGPEDREVVRVQSVDVRADVHTYHLRRGVRQKVEPDLAALFSEDLRERDPYAIPQVVPYRLFRAVSAERARHK